jgi:D-alanyl-lipoteichoic acid acyltransferase DltB (MBOAT superfamily)
VYRGKIEPTKDFLAYCTYVTFFPALLSGPISRATTQLPQYLRKRQFKYKMMSSAFKAIVWGIFMKVCIADRLGLYVDLVYSDIERHTGTSLFLAQLLYTFQIYADFAGYSLVAIGSGRFFGIELPTNFVRPYFSVTVTEFWRRWHISLTTWFRDYIYIPMGGNRVSKARWMVNTLVVFVLSGLWHGASYTFLVWGALHGAFMILEKLLYRDGLKDISKKWNIVNILRLMITFTIVSFLWIFFRSNNFVDAILIIKKIFVDHGGLFLDLMTFICGFVSLAILFVKEILEEENFIISNTACRKYGSYLLYVFLISYILLLGVLDGGQFIYFQF